MDVLGRRLADPFDAFWERYGPEIPASVEHIEEGHNSVFGDLGADRSAPDEPAWAGAARRRPCLSRGPRAGPPAAARPQLSYRGPRQRHTAGLRGGEGERRPAGDDRPRRAVGDPGAVRVQERLHPGPHGRGGFAGPVVQPRPGSRHGLVLDVGDSLLRPFEDLGPERWAPIEALYRERAPDAAELGRRLIAIVEDRGCGSPGKALWAMLQAREALDIDRRYVRIIDPAGGVY